MDSLLTNSADRPAHDAALRPSRVVPGGPHRAADARLGVRRSRLAVEITVALLVKFLLLYALWAAWFAHPQSRDLDGASVSAVLLSTGPSAATDESARDDSRH
jgi:hypothetical protein